MLSGSFCCTTREHFIKKRTKKEQKHMIALTGPNSNTGRNADSVVNDSEHIDVVLHASLELQDSAGSRVAWNPYL